MGNRQGCQQPSLKPSTPVGIWYLLPCYLQDAQGPQEEVENFGRGQTPPRPPRGRSGPFQPGARYPARPGWEGPGRAQPGVGLGAGKRAPTAQGAGRVAAAPHVALLSPGTAPGAEEASARPGRRLCLPGPAAAARLPS